MLLLPHHHTLQATCRFCAPDAGIEQVDAEEQGEHGEAAGAEWQNDVEGLVAVYTTMVSAPSHTSVLFTSDQLQVNASMLTKTVHM